MNKFNNIFFTILLIILPLVWICHFINCGLNDINSLTDLSSNLDSLRNCGKNIDAWLIKDLKWGSLRVGSQKFKDARIWPNHVEEWDWNKTGTRHDPGIQIADLADFIDSVDIIVLSEGVDQVLQIKSDTIDYLKKINKKYFIAPTPIAVEEYNRLLAEGKLVGALIHSTC